MSSDADRTSLPRAYAEGAYPSEWPNDDNEYAYEAFKTTCILLVLCVAFNLGAHAAQRRFEPVELHARMKDFRRQLGLLMWSRLKGELVAIGLTMAWVWLLSQIGLLQQLFNMTPSVHSSSPPQWNATSGALGFLVGLGGEPVSCTHNLPPTMVAHMHVIHDTQACLFIAMVLYFTFIWLALVTLMHWLAAYERLECGAVPRDSFERGTVRRLEAVRAMLLAAARTEPRLATAVSEMDGVKETVSRGELYVSGFVAEAIHAHVRLLVDFTPVTNLLCIGYVGALAIGVGGCTNATLLFTLGDLLWLLGTLYLSWRILLHSTTLRQGARRGPVRNPWPAGWVDRLLFPLVGPGVTGFVPCSASPPSALVAIRFLQAMVWFHTFRVGYYFTEPFGWAPLSPPAAGGAADGAAPAGASELPEVYNLPYRLLWSERTYVITITAARLVCVKLLSLLVWALWIIPGLLEAFSLPPFLSARQEQHLLHILSAFPNGRPDDVPPPSKASPAATFARALASSDPPTTDDLYAFARPLRAAWRWVWGSRDPIDRAQRLADHATWIDSPSTSSATADRLVVYTRPEAPSHALPTSRRLAHALAAAGDAKQLTLRGALDASNPGKVPRSRTASAPQLGSNPPSPRGSPPRRPLGPIAEPAGVGGLALL